MVHDFGPDPAVLGQCERCESPTNRFVNCANLACRALTLLCDACVADTGGAVCGPHHAGAPRAKSAERHDTERPHRRPRHFVVKIEYDQSPSCPICRHSPQHVRSTTPRSVACVGGNSRPD